MLTFFQLTIDPLKSSNKFELAGSLLIWLKHFPWTGSEIAYALGFTEVTHFNNFFKKHVELSPLQFRNV